MPRKKASKTVTKKQVEALTHEDASRKNIPTAEYESVMEAAQAAPKELRYPRNTDLDPQLVWRGKDEQDWSDLVVQAPPLYIQEKVHPKVLIEDLMRKTEREETGYDPQMDFFGDFNGIPEGADKTEFYQHDANWTNRMILGDSLQVMASLAEREGLRGQVQCIYLDPPYGIKFNSNFQWSTTSRDVKDGKQEHITREPEMVKAFRDTWRDGIHTYLTYLRDRLTVCRDLLSESGSIFVQIGDENVHRVRALLDEVFGDENHVADIVCLKTSSQTSGHLAGIADYVLFYAKKKDALKYRQLNQKKVLGEKGTTQYVWQLSDNLEESRIQKGEEPDGAVFAADNLASQSGGQTTRFEYQVNGKKFRVTRGGWKTNLQGMQRLDKSFRLKPIGNTLMYRRILSDYGVYPIANVWDDVLATGFSEQKIYVVQSSQKLIERCILMATDAGDLVLDPTCGSGTTAYVAEQWGRRWITIDTSRVALALARARIMGAKYPYYLLKDSDEGQQKEAELTRSAKSEVATYGNVRQGFVYERVPHITLKAIANNAEIDVIWEDYQTRLEPLREQLNQSLGKNWQEWEIPREAEKGWPAEAKKLHEQWWEQRIARQREIDASIAAKADYEYLYDKPYEDRKKVRVAGPFTVESLSPHRVLGVDEDDELIDPLEVKEPGDQFSQQKSFAEIILENLKTAGVQQAHKEDKINFTTLQAWPGDLVCAEGTYSEGEDGVEKRAAIFIGPEFGTVARADLVQAAREAGDAGFDVLIACAFNYEARTTDFDKLGRLPVLKARMNADLHMADSLKNTGSGNLFVIFGEPDIELLPDHHDMVRVKVNGVDVFKPQLGKVESCDADEIACWFIDTDYNEESFFVRHAYFLGASDPYKSLKTTLKAEINADAWDSLYSDTSRPFPKPSSGRIAVKVINHLGDEVMKVFRV
ncbi:site-specific DNA-methyltransferase [Ruficoccus sp. ZRK36]|uniref:site-specific DNA-methyltransferase n=1 Tax=Ruficoccus sp. ZRK36 TaxID=2866311 RepID=UPI001C7379DD|nr:site-specific DNA-methyltransferase [Ruficoccus sp. ZRK36]QYY37128.1 site-specific DNA-methyltransferase [Ruficoccus sp. ZRK36]